MEAHWFQLHYYLSENSHSMDAFVRNKCEKEILAIFDEVAKNLQLSIYIESFAYQEGGIKEFLKFIDKNKGSINTLSSVPAVLISLLTYSQLFKPNTELEQLTIETTRLEIEKKKLEIKKLQGEANSSENEFAKLIREIAKSLNKNIKIATRRSNFYKNLNNCQKIESVGFASTDNLSFQIEEKIVPRFEFQNFILASNELPVQTDENAVIEIFAPVLIEGGYNWRGFYLGKSITFSMNDDVFKKSVHSQEVKFQHGTRIRCVLDIHRKFDEIGEITITGYAVKTVLELSEVGINYVETKHGKRYRQNKKQSVGQIDVFDNSGYE